ncbi:MAG: hypothetical protein ACREOV_10040 [Candidatus Dormibacteraceae bacterium]
MQPPSQAPPSALLERPVFDAGGALVGRIGAIGTRHGNLLHVGIEQGTSSLRFVPLDRLTVERDRVVLAR